MRLLSATLKRGFKRPAAYMQSGNAHSAESAQDASPSPLTFAEEFNLCAESWENKLHQANHSLQFQEAPSHVVCTLCGGVATVDMDPIETGVIIRWADYSRFGNPIRDICYVCCRAKVSMRGKASPSNRTIRDTGRLYSVFTACRERFIDAHIHGGRSSVALHVSDDLEAIEQKDYEFTRVEFYNDEGWYSISKKEFDEWVQEMNQKPNQKPA